MASPTGSRPAAAVAVCPGHDRPEGRQAPNSAEAGGPCGGRGLADWRVRLNRPRCLFFINCDEIPVTKLDNLSQRNQPNSLPGSWFRDCPQIGQSGQNGQKIKVVWNCDNLSEVSENRGMPSSLQIVAAIGGRWLGLVLQVASSAPSVRRSPQLSNPEIEAVELAG